MRITVEIPDELAAEARARGLTPEVYVGALIEEAARSEEKGTGNVRGKMDMKTFLEAMAANSEKIPQLPDEAFTRESFYRDHD
ncbi:MAG TPA: hypothetical protein VMD55_09725 [Terracidiphilus sp.]|nr:hypothetical protein [Terracidiphilus sp.]